MRSSTTFSSRLVHLVYEVYRCTFHIDFQLSTRRQIYPIASPTIQYEIYRCTVSHGFSTFHAKRSPPHHHEVYHLLVTMQNNIYRCTVPHGFFNLTSELCVPLSKNNKSLVNLYQSLGYYVKLLIKLMNLLQFMIFTQ